jgi:hypothetical protein
MRFRTIWNRFLQCLNCVAIGITKLAKPNKLFTNFVVKGNVKAKRHSVLNRKKAKYFSIKVNLDII